MLKRIKVDYESIKQVTHRKQSDHYYDADSTNTVYNITGFHLVDDNDYCDIVADIAIIPGRKYVILYALFTSGDSFSTHQGQIDFIDIFDVEDSKNIITQNVAVLEDSKYNKRATVTLLTDSGIEYKYSVPWYGYFEKLESINLFEVCVKDESI